MNYKIGDPVVHCTHGLGKIIAIEEKEMAGEIRKYYVVEVDLFNFWVPVDDVNNSSIRPPTDKAAFEALFEILRTPGEPLSDHQNQRKNELRERMQKRTMADTCRIIRDLSDRSRTHTLNKHDLAVQFRAQEHLIDEWELSLGVSRTFALQALENLLQEDIPVQETEEPGEVST
jgi:CarD family transcriptional regulator